MAEKMVFIISNIKPYEEKIINYTYVPGFAPIQRKKNIINLHEVLSKEYKDLKVLEVSTKSSNELGIKLSAFNLKYKGYFIENIFQSSKVFSDNNQYEFLLTKKPLEAKRFIQNLDNKKIIKFRFLNKEYPLIPRSLFYDYIYVNALNENKDSFKDLINYDVFTDIEFNYKKSLNTQARACAIYTYLLRNNKVDEYLNDIELFKRLYDEE